MRCKLGHEVVTFPSESRGTKPLKPTAWLHRAPGKQRWYPSEFSLTKRRVDNYTGQQDLALGTVLHKAETYMGYLAHKTPPPPPRTLQ